MSKPRLSRPPRVPRSSSVPFRHTNRLFETGLRIPGGADHVTGAVDGSRVDLSEACEAADLGHRIRGLRVRNRRQKQQSEADEEKRHEVHVKLLREANRI
jgi:hypothetical protein